MAEALLKFAVTPRETPHKRAPGERAHDFAEIYDGFSQPEAGTQSSRCSQCGVPFCQSKCPLGNDIPDWLRLTAEGRWREAYELSQATSTLPEVCGRICPQDRLCEGACVVEQAGFGTVTIGAVEAHLSDLAWREGWVAPLRPLRELGLSVGIVGSGPAGLSAADRLRAEGYDVVVYDRHDRAGGLLTYGIPGFKLDKVVVDRRVRRLAEGGVEFRLGVDVGGSGGGSRDLAWADLRARHDAVLVATGVYAARTLRAPGGPEVTPALAFLIASNRAGFGDGPPPPELDAAGKRVVVLGGGDTAMDCVRTAVRQGAAAVTCVYRRDRANMPGSAREVGHAEEEGVVFDWLAAPAAVAEGAVVVQRMRLGAPDAGGRRAPEPMPGATERLEADLVIGALGFDAEDLPAAWDEPDLAVTPHGAIRIPSRSFATTLEGVFAAGDIVRGASLVVWAVKDGMDAAADIHRWLQGRPPVGARPLLAAE